MNPIGLYLHVPFCDGKCPYCDFFSLRAGESQMDAYTARLCAEIAAWQVRVPDLRADTLYLGGGTPSLLGAQRLRRILSAAAPLLLPGAEVTMEANPGGDLAPLLHEVAGMGVNRLSLGLQSAQAAELAALGRRHTAADAARAVEAAHAAGIANVSLDLMLAVPGQGEASLRRSIAFCAQSGAAHVSAYLLRVEPHTAFWQQRDRLQLPGEDQAADLYLLACEALEAAGFAQYEISNFARPGFQSRHNCKYWNQEPYLGLGPAAHAYLFGRRFFQPPSLRGFLQGAAMQEEEPDALLPAGSFAEYAMLRLRLCEGLTEAGCRARFGHGIPEELRHKAAPYQAAGLLQADDTGLRLRRRGFLVSTPLLSALL